MKKQWIAAFLKPKNIEDGKNRKRQRVKKMTNKEKGQGVSIMHGLDQSEN
jgi:hypothetical protein